LRKSKDPRGAPLLVETLGQREMVDWRWSSAKGKVACYSYADQAVEALIEMTGHNEGYDAFTSDLNRFEAMDRWNDWWRTEGCAQYLKVHPEVTPILTED